MSRDRARVLARDAQVFLRRPTPDDFEEYTALRRASADFLRPWEPRPPRGPGAVNPLSREGYERWLADANTEHRQRTLICLVRTGAIAGGINLNEIVRGPFQSCFVGYWVGAPHARQGIASHALPLMLGYAFDTLGLHRVEANLIPTNEPSRRLVQKTGLRLEGVAPRFLQINGRWRTHERWAITAEEWAQGRTR